MGIAYYSSEYGTEEYLDAVVDVYKFYEDDEYRNEVYEMLEELLDEERRIHQEVIEDLKEEKQNYVK
jgi:predicted P-loop ATPase/GTPase